MLALYVAPRNIVYDLPLIDGMSLFMAFAASVIFLTVLGVLVYQVGLSLVTSQQKLRTAQKLAARYGVALSLAFALAFYGDWWDVVPWCWCMW